MESLFIIAGLGNPGIKYRYTRHNIGFLVIDKIADEYCIEVKRLRHKAYIGEGLIEGRRALLVKPQTYMNLSGESIRDIVDWYKLPMDKLTVIYDDADLSPGNVRIRAKGSSGTHNGMKSIIYHLQTDEFPRIRIGIGNAPEGWDLADYVLSTFNGDQATLIHESIERAASAAAKIITEGVEKAMNLYNGER